MDMLLLSALKTKDCYGYEMVKLISKLSNGLIQIKEGTMYPILYSLQEKQYISSFEVVADRKIRVYYHLEQEGLKYLNQIISEYNTLIEGINNVISNSSEEI